LEVTGLSQTAVWSIPKITDRISTAVSSTQQFLGEAKDMQAITGKSDVSYVMPQGTCVLIAHIDQNEAQVIVFMFRLHLTEHR